MSKSKIVIIGGGAAGFFAAITCAENNSNCEIIILEQSKEVLSKVRVSGGGRCNVTHACFNPKDLVAYYPRGHKELLGPFMQFGPKETVEWFETRNVPLKTEKDGRMFPVSDMSESIIQCFQHQLKKYNINVFTQSKVKNIDCPSDDVEEFIITTDMESIRAHKLMIATGSSPFFWNILEQKGIKIIPPVPSLFTFNIQDKKLNDLMGVSVQWVKSSIKSLKKETEGPLLITHWGVSGPVVLKMSAIAAVELAACQYQFDYSIDWLPNVHIDTINEMKQVHVRKKITHCPFETIPTRLWNYFLSESDINPEKLYADINKKQWMDLANRLKQTIFKINGKSTFKEEFVTAGGVALKQIDFKRFESKTIPNLFFAGEVLNIDAVTGGFNFQAAWTGGYLAGKSMAE